MCIMTRGLTSAALAFVLLATPVHAEDDSFFTHLHAERAMANVTVSPGRAGPVEIEIQLEDANEAPLTAAAVSVTLGNSENGVVPVTVNAERVADDRWMVWMSAPKPGRWSLALGIAIYTVRWNRVRAWIRRTPLAGPREGAVPARAEREAAEPRRREGDGLQEYPSERHHMS